SCGVESAFLNWKGRVLQIVPKNAPPAFVAVLRWGQQHLDELEYVEFVCALEEIADSINAVAVHSGLRPPGPIGYRSLKAGCHRCVSSLAPANPAATFTGPTSSAPSRPDTPASRSTASAASAWPAPAADSSTPSPTTPTSASSASSAACPTTCAC